MANCYNDCFKALLAGQLEFLFKDVILVHGIPTMTGGPHKGKQYGHSWLEFSMNGEPVCMDVGMETIIPKDLFYTVGNISYTKKYTRLEAMKLANETNRVGPWDKKIYDSLHTQSFEDPDIQKEIQDVYENSEMKESDDVEKRSSQMQ